MTGLEPESEKDVQRRITVAYVVIWATFFLIVLRLWQLQIIGGDEYRDLSRNNRMRIQRIPASRGIIFDRFDRILVDNRPSFNVSVVPQDLARPAETLDQLSSLLKVSEVELKETMEKRRGRPPFKPVTLKADVSRELLGMVSMRQLDLPGVVIEVVPTRHYLFGDFASHLLGYLGEVGQKELGQRGRHFYRPGDMIGRYGVEERTERALRGTAGTYQIEVDALGHKINVVRGIEPYPGDNCHVTIDADIQRVAEETLGDRAGAVVALSPKGGEILAMVSHLSFDPNLFSQGISAQDWRDLVENPLHPLWNKAIQGQVPPGSIFKVVSVVAGLEEGLIAPEATVTCRGRFRLGNRVFRCWKKEGHGTVDLEKAVVESCDVYFYRLALDLGVERLADYAERFGLGKPTGIELAGENGGLVPTPEWKKKSFGTDWQKGETILMGIGQSFLAVTPLQMVNLYAALGNGGILYKPRYVKGVSTPEGQTRAIGEPWIIGRIPASDETISTVVDCLQKVVEEPGGTGRSARIPGFRVAGKTGTAQVVSNVGSVREEDLPPDLRAHAWFVAFAPAEEAEIAVAVMVEHGGHGATTAAPIARAVIKKFLEKREEGHV
jgi:penicillin-binding protein 2